METNIVTETIITTTLASQPRHILLLGDTGTGKSQLAASAARATNPQLIALFDSLDNATPYLRSGPLPWHVTYVDEARDVIMDGARPSIIPTYLCYDKEEKLLRKIWHFGALDVSNPEGMLQWRVKLAKLSQELQAIGATNFVFDSFTLFETLARRRAKFYSEGPPAVNNSNNDRAWMYAVTDYVEDVCLLLKSLPCSVIAISHLSVDQKGNTTVNLSGRMARNAAAMFGNVWLCHIDAEGNYRVKFQGNLGSPGINAKNTVEASLEALPNDYATIVTNAAPIQWRKRL